jgi:YbgC/YbaW family acyl-CoA thioester hydrolase
MDNKVKKSLWSCKVRDHECDMGFFVNNAVYLYYLEQARHDYLRELKFDPVEYARKKIAFVVGKIDVTYRHALKSCDEFVVETTVERLSKHRFLFIQNIYLLPERIHILDGKIILIPINSAGRADLPNEIETLLGAFPIPTINKND